MDEATPQELAVLVAETKAHLNDRLVDTMVGLLEQLRGPLMGNPVDRYEHSLQTASRALRDGARTDMVVAALLHDVGDAMAPGQPQRARGRDRPAVPRCGKHLGGSPPRASSRATTTGTSSGSTTPPASVTGAAPTSTRRRTSARAWDQLAFDPDYETLPIETFLPLLTEVFSRPASGFGAD